MPEKYKNAGIEEFTDLPDQDKSKHKHILPTRFSTDEQQLFMDFGKKVLSESIDHLKDFIKFMVPLTTGLITAYIAILEFIGIETINESANTSQNLITPRY